MEKGANMTRTSETHPIRVDFLNHPQFPILNGLGMTFAPGKSQHSPMSGGSWKRDLKADIKRLKDFYGTDALISLIEEFEYEQLGIRGMWSECYEVGIDHTKHEIPDQGVPSEIRRFRFLLSEAIEKLCKGKRVVVHCKGGLGRAGTVTACLIIAATDGKVSADDAMTLVRMARGSQAIENSVQETFIRKFAEMLRKERELSDFITPQLKTADVSEVVTIGAEGGGMTVKKILASDGKWYFFPDGNGGGSILDDWDEEEEDIFEPLPHKLEVYTDIDSAFQELLPSDDLFMFLLIQLDPEHKPDLIRFAEGVLAQSSEERKRQFRNRYKKPLSVEAWFEACQRFGRSF
jgi:protein-tyrosine phosphatase